MADTVNIDGLASAIVSVLSDYEALAVSAVQDAVSETAKSTVSGLKSSSPRRSGEYAKSWAQKSERSASALQSSRVVYNKDHYRLTHLLEHGHALKRGGRTYGRVKAYPHIGAAEERAAEELIRRLKEAL